MRRMLNILRAWLPMAVVTIGLGGLSYLLVQQALRQGANDPQIQMAEDATAAFAQGQSSPVLLSAFKVEIARSLAPFMIVYNDDGSVLTSSAGLHGEDPELPAGVLDYVRANGEDRVTWQPEEGVRIAAVILRFEGEQPGFVLAGRSLREVERRVDQMVQITGLALLVTLVASLAAVAFGEFFLRGRRSA